MTDVNVPGEQPIIQDGEEISPELRRRGFRLMMLSSIFSVVGGQVFAGNVMLMIAWNLGGRERYFGLLQFLIFVGAAVQLLVVSVAQRTCKKHLALTMITLGYLATIPVFFTQSVPASMGLVLLACCVCVRQMCMAVAQPSWMGLLREMTEPKRRGRLLGTLRRMWQSMLVVMLVLTGLYLGEHPPWRKLQWVIAFALAAQLLRLLALLGVPRVPKRRPAGDLSWRQMIGIPLRDDAYRPFLLYQALYGLALGVCEPFRIVYLLRLGFAERYALIASSLIGLGAVVTLMFWGRLADKFGNRGVFGLTLAGVAVCPLLWLFVNSRAIGLMWAMALFALAGAFNAGNGLVQTRYMFGSLRAEFDAAYIALSALCTSLAVGAGSLIGGHILDLGLRAGLAPGNGMINNYHLIFLLGSGLFFLTFRFRRRFREPTETPTREVFTAITRPLRVMVGPLLFWPKNDDDTGDRTCPDRK